MWGGEFIYGYYAHTIKSHRIDYVVINKQIYTYPSFLVGDPLDPKKMDDFDRAKLQRIYDNGQILIYEKHPA